MSSYRFIGPDTQVTGNLVEGFGTALATGDFDNDGVLDYVFGAQADRTLSGGSHLYVLNGTALAAADAADGTTDFTIDLSNVAGLNGSYEIFNTGFATGFGTTLAAGAFGADRQDGLIVGAPNDKHAGNGFGSAFLFLGEDLADLDAADGFTDGRIDSSNASYVFFGDQLNGKLGSHVAAIDESFTKLDDADDILISAPQRDSGANTDEGAVWLISPEDLARLDGLDGTTDRQITLADTAANEGPFGATNLIEGGASGHVFGNQAVDVGQVFDTEAEFHQVLIGGRGFSGGEGRVYLVPATELGAADEADGTIDGVVQANFLGQGYIFEGAGTPNEENLGSGLGYVTDMNGDGLNEVLIGGVTSSVGGNQAGVAYLVMGAGFEAADEAGGPEDRVIDLTQVAGTEVGGTVVAYRFIGDLAFGDLGTSFAAIGDIDRDGRGDFVISAPGISGGGAYLVTAASLTGADAADGTTDGSITMSNLIGREGSYLIREGLNAPGVSVTGVADQIGQPGGGDGFPDLMIGHPGLDISNTGNAQGGAYLVSAGDLATLDALDGTQDGQIDLLNFADRSTGVELRGTAQTDRLAGRDGDDTVFGEAGNDSISTDAGNDLIYGGANFDFISAGTGDDTVFGGDGRDTVFLKQGDDLFNDNAQGGDLGRDLVYAGFGDDTIQGGNGNDTFYGEWGADVIKARKGDDLVFGGDQFDTITAGEGNDTVYGGNGQDLVYLNQGNDLFNDNAQGGPLGNDTVFTGLGDDTVQGGNGDDVFFGEDGNDLIFARLGDDSVYGGANFDTIDSGDGNDLVYGGLGRDQITLGAGDDRFVDTNQAGELGQDTITGGDGADTFVFGASMSTDTITDFEVGVDTLQLDAALVGDATTGQAVVDSFTVFGDGFMLLNFGSANIIRFEGLTNMDGMADSIEIL